MDNTNTNQQKYLLLRERFNIIILNKESMEDFEHLEKTKYDFKSFRLLYAGLKTLSALSIIVYLLLFKYFYFSMNICNIILYIYTHINTFLHSFKLLVISGLHLRRSQLTLLLHLLRVIKTFNGNWILAHSKAYVYI